jgi:hypothetical protein
LIAGAMVLSPTAQATLRPSRPLHASHEVHLILGTPGELTRAMPMAAGWLINVALAQWIIRRRWR